MSSRVVVIDYGIGNLHSVLKALRHEGAEVTLTSDGATVEHADRLVLPGVGAFADGMRELRTRGLVEAIRAYVARERPFLGICLGMQLLLSESEEFGRHEGLDVIPGKVVKITPRAGVKVPHVGWTPIVPPEGGSWAGSILEGTPEGTMAYFVHSFTAVPTNESDRLADAWYGDYRVSAAVRRGPVVGCQFHPEKSGPAGLAIVRRFLSL